MSSYRSDEPPTAGGGLHDWILRVTRELAIRGYTSDSINDYVLARASDKGRPAHILTTEVANAVHGALEYLINNDGYVETETGFIRGRRPVDPLARISDPFRLRVDRREEYLPLNTPLRQKALDKHCKITVACLQHWYGTGFYLARLWGNIDFYLCAARQLYDYRIMKGSWWTENDRYQRQQYIVPNPIWDPNGKKTDDNTCQRTFQIVEFDKEPDLDNQARLLWQLGSIWPLVMIVYSGSKSLHGWFACYHASEYRVRTFFRKATQLGADRQMRVPCQYTRMPLGTNLKTGRKQEVIFWSEELIEWHRSIIRKDLKNDSARA